MAYGGTYQLSLADSRFDNMIYATDLLKQRLDSTRKKNPEKPIKSSDVESTHISYVSRSFKPHIPVKHEYIRVSAQGNSTSISADRKTLTFTLPSTSDFLSDIVFHVKVKSVGSATNSTILYRFCDYLGIRLFEKVTLKYKGLVVDEYTSEDMQFYDKFEIKDDNRPGWEKCVGQQETKYAEFNNYYQQYTNVFMYKDGPQSSKYMHETFDLFIPAIFWFCKSPECAIKNKFIGTSERSIEIQINKLSNILKSYNGINLKSNTAFGAEIPLALSSLDVEINMYANQIYVSPDLGEIYSRSGNISLIRVHKQQKQIVNTPSGEILLNSLKFPIENIKFGFRDTDNKDDFNRWFLYGKPKTRVNLTKLYVNIVRWDPDPMTEAIETIPKESYETSSLEPVVSQLGLLSSGIEIYPIIDDKFYNAYFPLRYQGDKKTITPKDRCVYAIYFGLKPGKSTPSGYFTASTTRELYLKYNGNTISTSDPHELVICSDAINILVNIEDSIKLAFNL